MPEDQTGKAVPMPLRSLRDICVCCKMHTLVHYRYIALMHRAFGHRIPTPVLQVLERF